MRLLKNCIVRVVEDPVRAKRMQEDGWEPESETRAANKADKDKDTKAAKKAAEAPEEE